MTIQERQYFSLCCICPSDTRAHQTWKSRPHISQFLFFLSFVAHYSISLVIQFKKNQTTDKGKTIEFTYQPAILTPSTTSSSGCCWVTGQWARQPIRPDPNKLLSWLIQSHSAFLLSRYWDSQLPCVKHESGVLAGGLVPVFQTGPTTSRILTTVRIQRLLRNEGSLPISHHGACKLGVPL